MLENVIYLDNAATTRVYDEVIDVMTEVLKDCYGNPSSTHAYGRNPKSSIEIARKEIAKEIGAESSEIIFTSGGTEANNLILNSSVRDLGVKHIITSKVEHHAVLHTVQELEKYHDITLDYVKLDHCGFVDYKDLEKLLKNSKGNVLVSLMYVNNEIGNKLNIDEVVTLCKKYNALFHSDAVQGIGHFRFNLKNDGIDFISAAAHKFHGPKGVGFAYIKKGSGMKSLIFGGGQEKGLRAGTEPVHNIVGMHKAFEIGYKNLDRDTAFIKGLKDYAIQTLSDNFEDVEFNGGCGTDNSTYTVLNICIPRNTPKSSLILFYMDLNGIAVSAGSACQSGSQKGSHVLNAIECMGSKFPSLRISFSHYNTKKDIDRLVEVLKEIYNEQLENVSKELH